MANNTTNGFSTNSLYKLKQAADTGYVAFAYGEFTATNASLGIASILPTEKPRMMHIYVESTTAAPDIAIRYRVDGGAPVATTTGIPRVNGDEFFVYEFANIQKFRVIEEVANTTVLRITFYQ